MHSYAVAYNATPLAYNLPVELELGNRSSDSGSDTDPDVIHPHVPKILAVCSGVAFILGIAAYGASGRSFREDGAGVRRWLDSEASSSEVADLRKTPLPMVASGAPLTAQPINAYPAAEGAAEGAGAPAASMNVLTNALTNALTNSRRAVPKRETLKPSEHQQDGNVCDDHEEVYLGLCYSKCAILTNGTHRFRSSAFTCCTTKACGVNVFKMRTASLVPCSGFDTTRVNGDTDCPHLPGACLTDEEQYLGECYETCRKLTNGVYDNRVGVATCCKTDGLACLVNSELDYTAAKLDVGGGAGDHDDTTPRRVHFPLKSLTEEKHRKASLPAPPASNARRVPLGNVKPNEPMYDGNPCDNSEELFLGLCYKKCELLTGGRYRTRKSAFMCCQKPNCGITQVFKMKTASLVPCSGNDVSSADGGTACPHALGACLKDEELWGGECFETCSLLTNGSYPNRVTAATCCKAGGASCFDPRNDWTATRFDVGGGIGDNDAQTPHSAHFPLKRLTEASV